MMQRKGNHSTAGWISDVWQAATPVFDLQEFK